MEEAEFEIPDIHTCPRDQQGVVTLSIDDGVHIYLSPREQGQFFAHMVLIEAPYDLKDREEIFSTLMQANHFQKGTKTGWFSFDAQLNLVFLCALIPESDTHGKKLAHAIQNLYSTHKYWKEELARKQEKKTAEDHPSLLFKI